MTPGCTGEPWNAPAWYFSSAKAATHLPSFVAPSLTRIVAPDVGPDALNTSSRDITIFTGRLALRDSASASGSREIVGLPPTPAPPADLGGGDAELADVHAEQPRAVGAHDVMALGRAPQLGRAVLRERGQRRVGLDVALVHGRGLELALDDHVGLLEARVDVAEHDLHALG